MPSSPTRPAPLSPDGVQQAAQSRSIQVLWYDGRRSKPWPTWARLRPGPKGISLSLHPMDGAASSVHLLPHEVNWPEIWSKRKAQSPLIVDLGTHGTLEIHDVEGWQTALHAVGKPPGIASKLTHNWQLLALTGVLAVGIVAAFYRWGTPWAAQQLARFVPLSLEQQVSDQYLSQLDENMLRPSQIAPERQAQLRQGFQTLLQGMPAKLPIYRDYRPEYRLEFRSGMGANAFALPGGTIVMTDEIIQHAKRQKLPDDALLGVLAHEIGHVANRHTSRAVLQQAVLQAGLSLALGDFSGILNTAATTLTSLSYSRAHERESDCFAMGLMQALGKPTKPMGDLLLTLDSGPHDDTEGDKASPPATPAASAEARPGTDWYLTHPDTATRARMLSEGKAHDCR